MKTRSSQVVGGGALAWLVRSEGALVLGGQVCGGRDRKMGLGGCNGWSGGGEEGATTF